MKKKVLSAIVIVACIALTACSKAEETEKPVSGEAQTETETQTVQTEVKGTEESASNGGNKVNYAKIYVDESKKYQDWAGFGASEAWWSQYVGGWDNIDPLTGREMREQIARMLYSKEDGLGLTIYRYNVGAGSVELDQKGSYADDARRAQCFETEPGVYDFSKDANAVWFMKKCSELAGDEFEAIFFVNSPLVRLTNSGHAYLDKGTVRNIEPDKYPEFVKYVFDVAEHFKNEEGINVTEISPINEPQWEWTGGQEGCHYETDQMVEVLKAFVSGIGNRAGLSGVRISGPESGEWGGKTEEYVKAIMSDPVLGGYFDTLDCHSYWTTSSTKSKFKGWVSKNYPDLKLRCSEWCEMVNGDDYTMDSAFNMAAVIMDDIKILGVESWQDWVAVAPGNYRDGVLYVSKSQKKYRIPKRYYGFGNFTRYIRPGYTRVDIANDAYSNTYKLNTVAFAGVNDEGRDELVVVLINREDTVKRFNLDVNDPSRYSSYHIYTTTDEYDLECTNEGSFDKEAVMAIEGNSITTIVLN